jgi:hypothetical protein
MSTDWLYGALPVANNGRNWLYGVVRKKSSKVRTEPVSDDGHENICQPSRKLRSNSFSQFVDKICLFHRKIVFLTFDQSWAQRR